MVSVSRVDWLVGLCWFRVCLDSKQKSYYSAGSFSFKI